MHHRKHVHRLRYPIIAVTLAMIGVFLFMHRNDSKISAPSLPEKQQTGYKAEDRQKLEQLIHQGAKDD